MSNKLVLVLLVFLEEIHHSGISFGDELLEILACAQSLLILLCFLDGESLVGSDLELKRLSHPGLVLFALILARSVQLGDEVVEFGHSLILSMLGVFHRVEKLLTLDLKCAEVGLNVDVGLVDVCSHLLLLKSHQTSA